MANPAECSHRPPSVSLKDFAAHAVHEVSNPLNAISINAELATQLISAGRSVESLELLKRLTRDVWQCGSALRDFARLGAALDGPLQLASFASLLDEVCESVAQLARRPSEQFVIQIAEPVPEFLLEPTSLRYGLCLLIKLLITESTQRILLSARLEGTEQVLLLVSAESAVDAPPGRQRAPMGLAFVEQILGHQNAHVHWRLDLGSAFEIRFDL